MAVAQTAARVSVQAGNGAKVAFDGTWKIFATTDLTVYKVGATGTYTLCTNVTDYAVTFDTDAETWTVTFVVAPVSSGYAVIFGDAMTFDQASSLPREGVTPAATLKNAIDKLTVLVQQVRDKADRAVLQPLTPANPEPIDIDPLTDRRALIAQDNGDNTWTIIPSTYDPDEQYPLAQAQAAIATAQAAVATAQAVAAAASAVAAAASAALVTNAIGSGLYAARPAAPTSIAFYHSTDRDSLELWIPSAARWYLIG